uniref:Glycerophosphodiester phosphodiesterase domain containing 5 n=1 Tax=Nothobranchius furzeri TaxID=105023 RepID=A0A8C6L3G1_NOTFU
MVKHQPLQVYERQLCLSCITGIYGCRWKRYQRSHDDTTKWELLWSLILLVTFCLLLIWFYFWWEAHNDYNEFNWFLYNRSGEWSDGTAPILATTAAGFTYIAFLMVLALCHVALGQQLNLHWLHKVTCLVCICVGLVDENCELQGATGPFLHIGALAAVTALSWIVAGQVARAEKTSIVLLGLYVVPLYISSPCIMDHSTLKPRPEVFGHQGAPTLAPENTLWSFQRALQMNVTGLETDVVISVDGVPFLMHDPTLRRTTDVEKVFPDRQMDEASRFNWTDLQQLNAGQWFLKNDPFWTVNTFSVKEKNLTSNQRVCSLEQLLKLASYHNISVVFRLQRPPQDHPCFHSWINDTLQAVQRSGVPPSLVMWTPDEQRAQVRRIAPGLVQTSLDKHDPHTLHKSGISRLMLRYSQVSPSDIRNFSKNNISLTLYTVNEPWLYSTLWCSGVSSVSSEAPHVLRKVLYPIWLMGPREYGLIWVSADLVSFAVVVGIFILQKYRMSGMRSYNPEQIMLSATVRTSSRDMNVMKEKLIFSGKAVAGGGSHASVCSNSWPASSSQQTEAALRNCTRSMATAKTTTDVHLLLFGSAVT